MNADPIVLDASAVIALIKGESAGPEIAGILRDSARRGGRRMVPDGFWLEVANVLVRRYGRSPNEVVEAIRDIDDLDLESIRLDRAMLLVTIDIESRTGLSAYDAAYLALAEVEDGRLVSLDQQLIDAAGQRAIRLADASPRRSEEAPASYEANPIDWARFGPYLAQLRVEALASGRRPTQD